MKPEELPKFFDALDEWATLRSPPTETVAYGDHPDQVVDLRLPAAPGPHPLAVVLHGGFWRAGYTRRNTSAVAAALADAGWATANVEYRRGGPGAWRPMLDDVLAARRSLAAFEYAVAIGHSAGGHLALWLGAEGAVDAVAALAGVCNLRAAANARLGDGAVQELLGGEPTEVPDAFGVTDPVARLPLGVPQVLLHGIDDDRIPISHARNYAISARAAGDECRVVALACGHFEVMDPRSAVWPRVARAVEALAPSGATA